MNVKAQLKKQIKKILNDNYRIKDDIEFHEYFVSDYFQKDFDFENKFRSLYFQKDFDFENKFRSFYFQKYDIQKLIE